MSTQVHEQEVVMLNAQLKSELEYMAYQGAYTSVYDRYHMLPQDSRALYENADILSGVVRGGIELLQRSGQGKTPGNRQDKEFVEQALDRFIDYCSDRNTSPRELFECILAWTMEPASLANTDSVVHYLDRAETSGVSRYPDLHARLMLVRAELLTNAGRHKDAHRILSGLAEKYYLVPDRNTVSSIILMLGKTALMAGQAQSYKSLLFSGLRYFYTRDTIRLLFAGQLVQAYRSFYRIFFDHERSFSDKLLFLAHWFYHGVSRNPIFVKLRFTKLVRLAVLAYVYFLNYRSRGGHPSGRALLSQGNQSCEREGGVPARNGREVKKAFLVTRAMGGIGDLLMMTPGLHALKEMHPDHEIFFATPREYHQLFIGNNDVHLLEIEKARIDAGDFRKWFNFTDCPAARIESRTVPDVKMNRVDIFARSLGIRGKRLRKMDRRPRYFLTESEKEFQRWFWEEHRLQNKRVIGVQLSAAERYKNYPHMADLIRRLAADFIVIVFHNGKTPALHGDNIIDPSPLPLRHAFALAASCTAIIAPDSSFVHFAAAFDIPCIVLAGPIDGKNRIRPYRRCRFVDARKVLQCVPCWRNEVIPCKLTNMKTSACMGNIQPEEIKAALFECIRELKHETKK